MRIRGPASLLVMLALCGCGSSPTTHFYAVEPVPAASPAAPVQGPPVTLTGVHLPPTLDRRELVRRGPGNSVEVSGEDRWAAPLDEMVLRVLGQDLATRLPPDRFVEPDLPKPPQPRRELVVTLEEFDVADGRAVLTGDWALLAGSPAVPVLRRHERIERPSAGSSQATAMSALLAELAERIAAGIRESGPSEAGQKEGH